MEQLITMSKMELSRLEVMQRLFEKRLYQREASEILGLSLRQIKRLFKRYVLYGVEGIQSKKRGRPSNNKAPETLRKAVTSIISDYYHDFGPTLACEKLFEIHDIKLSVETVRKLMIGQAYGRHVYRGLNALISLEIVGIVMVS